MNNKIEEALHLLHSMVLSGERTDGTATKLYHEALEALNNTRGYVWTKTTDGLPEKSVKERYEQIPCLVIDKEFKYMDWLVWDCERNCWLDRYGDEYKCEPYGVSHWMPLPEMPSDLK